MQLDGVTVTGGTLTDEAAFEVTGSSTITGATINNGTGAVNGSAIIDANQTLTLDGSATADTAVSDITFTDTASGAKLSIDSGTVSLTGVVINGGTLDIALGAVLDLYNTQIVGVDLSDLGTINVFGNSTIDSFATVYGGLTVVAAEQTLFLDNALVTGNVTNDGTLQIDLTDEATFSGVAVTSDAGVAGTIDDYGTIDVTGASSITGSGSNTGAELNGNRTGTIMLDAGLTLGYVELSGITIETDNSSLPTLQTLTIAGPVEVAGAVTLADATIDGGDNAITVDANQTLTLNGVTLEDVTLSGGTDDLTGSVTIGTGGGTIETAIIDGGDNAITVDANQTLTLNGVTLEDVTLSGGTDDLTGSVTIGTGGGTIETAIIDGNSNTITVDANQTLTLNGVTLEDVTLSGGTDDLTGSVTIGSGGGTIETATIDGNGNTITVDTGQTLTLSGVTLDNVTLAGSFTNTGTLTIDDTVTLDGATLTGGAITDDGNIAVTGNDGTIASADITGGDLTAAAGTMTLATDTLDNVTLDGSFTDTGTLAIDDTVTLDGASLGNSGATIDDTGTLSVTAASTITDGTIDGGGTLSVDSGATLTLSGVTLDNVTLDGSFTDTGALAIDDTVTLDGATLTGGAITDDGNIAVTGNDGTIAGADITGGDLTAAAGTMTLATDTLDSVTLAGSFTDSGALTIDDTVTLDGASLGNSGATIDDTGTLSVTAASTITGGTVDGGGTLSASGATLTLSGVTLDNVSLGGSFTNTGTLTIDDTVTLDGATLTGGAITDDGNIAVGDGDTASTINVNTVTIETGTSIQADNGTLTLDYNEPGSSNSGTIAAIDGGKLTINHELTDNGGVYTAATATTETGGIIEADGAGSMLTLNSLQGDANQGTLEAADGGKFSLNVALNPNYVGGGGNSGTMEALGGGAFSYSGEGLNAAGATIKAIGADSTFEFSNGDYSAGVPTDVLNEGTIVAAHGGTVEFNITSVDDDGGVKNQGAILAAHDGTVEFTGTEIDNVGGDIAAYGAGSTVQLSNVGIGGGTLTTDDPTSGDAGLVEIVAPAAGGSNTTFFDGVSGTGDPGPLTIDAFVQVQAAADLVLSGTIDNEGAIDVLDSTPAGGTLVVDGPVDLNGTGAVTLDGGDAAIVGAAGVSGNALDNFSTISGAGNIGGNGLKLDNESIGTIDADAGGQTLSIDTGAKTIGNAGLLEATNGGDLAIGDPSAAGTINNSNSITAGDGSVIAFANETVVNTGTISLDGSVAAAEMIIHGSLTLQGGDGTSTGPGEVTLSGTSEIVSDLNPATLTNVDNTISGSGTIGDQYLTLQNDQHGVIDATGGPTSLLILNTGSNAVSNAGTLEAADGATLQIDSAVDNSGTIEATGTASAVDLVNVTISGGTLTTGDAFDADSGAIDVGSDESVLDGSAGAVTLSGYVQVDPGASLELKGTISDSGLINVDGQTLTADLVIDGTVTLNGGGAVIVQGPTDEITGASTGILDNFDTISGGGSIGDGSGDLTLFNETGGTVDGSGETLTLDTGNTVTNAGTLEATGGGTLTIDDSVDNTGTITADGGNVDVVGAVTDTGSAHIGDGGILEFQASVAAGQTVTFDDATGTLALSDPVDFHAAVAGFGAGNAVDLSTVTYAPEAETGVWTQESGSGTLTISTEYDVWTQGSGGGTLQIYTGATLDATLNFTGTYQQYQFALASDGNATPGTDVVASPLSVTNNNGVETATASSSAATLVNENGHWVVGDNGYTTTVDGVGSVVIGTHTYLLVGDGGFSTIQSAVNAASAGDTILIAPGTYTEQVTVGSGLNGLTIEAADGAGTVTVDAPTALTQTAVSPVSGDSIDALFTVNGANNVTVSGITFNGLQYGDDSHFAAGQTNPSLIGISYIDSTGGDIDGVTVTGMRESDGGIGDQRNFGIYVANTDTLAGDVPTSAEAAGLNTITITGSTIANFQKAGIVVEYANATINDNQVTGVGEVDQAQNGIQVDGSTGTVSNNTISNIDYSGSDYAATGILAFYNEALNIDGNSFTGVAGGNLLSPVGVYVLDSTAGEIENNFATYVDNGIAVLSDGFGAGNDLLGAWTIEGNATGVVAASADGGDSIYFDPDPTSAAASFVATGGANDVGDVFFVSPGANTLTGGGGGGNTFVVLAGSDLSSNPAIDTIDGGGPGNNTIDFASGTSGDTLIIGSNVTDIQNVDVVGPTYAQTDTTPLAIDASAAPNALTITANDGGDTITGTATYDDTLIGGTGNDTFIVGSGNDFDHRRRRPRHRAIRRRADRERHHRHQHHRMAGQRRNARRRHAHRHPGGHRWRPQFPPRGRRSLRQRHRRLGTERRQSRRYLDCR